VQIYAAQADPPAAPRQGPAVSRALLQADLANAQGHLAWQAVHIKQLERKLSELPGEQAWKESGLAGPTDIDQLRQRITTLEQQVVVLTSQLEDRDLELEAARTATGN
jgi:chaperonin cofactor prefoldin